MWCSLFVVAVSNSVLGPVPKPEVIELAALVKASPNAARGVTLWFDQDRGNLLRTYSLPWSPIRDGRLAKFYADWSEALAALDKSKLNDETKSELDALKKRVNGLAEELAKQAAERNPAAGRVPFAGLIAALDDGRRRADPLDSAKAAATLNRLKKEVLAAKETFEKDSKGGKVTKEVARSATAALDDLTRALRGWNTFYAGYDPLFDWWCAQPVKEAETALQQYATAVKAAKELPSGQYPAVVTITPAKGPSDVPDLNALLNEPISEMTPVLERYRATEGGRFPGGGGGGRGAPPATDRSKAWLTGLKRIDFDKLSRPAQVDYLLFQHQLQSQVKGAELRAKLGQPKLSAADASGIRGRPIGDEQLIADLAGEMIPYTPQQLIDLAEEEYKWCLAEMKKASRDMGFDDWKQALEKVKGLHVPPGKQPELVHELSDEAVAFVRKHQMLTVPPICDETWRMTMIPPERQIVSPFFLGGETVQIAYPTDSMPYEAKMQSMRGNNRHFSKATVHHELIPGHGLQQYSTARSNTHRGRFSTPFWTEGWALYMEFVLYDKGFPTSPEDRVGMLFWRMHRCARVVFSLGFHTGKLTPQQCIDYLVEKVGHERDNAAAEVRRSFEGGYGPLYQLAYLIGGLQFKALRRELVDGGKMSEKAYHDAVMKGNRMPVEMVRASLTTEKLTPDSVLKWKFAEQLK